MKFLLTGANGQLGWELARLLPRSGQVSAFERSTLEFGSTERLRQVIQTIRPEVIFNAAAYTAVDQAEREPEPAFAVNATAPGVLAEEAAKLGALLVHYSSDYVFDGTKDGPYVEDDAANPLSVYGRSKLSGELAIRRTGCDHLILRTSWVYAGRGKNFLIAIRRLAAEREELRVVSDQHGAPTWARDLAQATLQAVRATCAERSRCGTYHMSANGETTWHGFAEAIVSLAPPRGRPAPRIVPIPAAEYPTAARRPANSRLSNARLLAQFGIALPDWRESTANCIEELLRGC